MLDSNLFKVIVETIQNNFDVFITSFVSVIAIYATYNVNKKLIQENRALKNKEYQYSIRYKERNEIIHRLKGLYGPIQILRRLSAELHIIFKDGKDFKTLSKLIDGEKFSDNDQTLINEIIELGNRSKETIIKNAGLIDDKSLRDDYLPKLLTHYILISNALKGTIQGEVHRFEDFTFPNEIDKIIDGKVNELNKKLEKLSRVD